MTQKQLLWREHQTLGSIVPLAMFVIHEMCSVSAFDLAAVASKPLYINIMLLLWTGVV